MIMPEGLDPADSSPSTGSRPCAQAAAGARPLVEYMLRRTVGRHDLATVEGQVRRGRGRAAAPRSGSRDPGASLRVRRTCWPTRPAWRSRRSWSRSGPAAPAPVPRQPPPAAPPSCSAARARRARDAEAAGSRHRAGPIGRGPADGGALPQPVASARLFVALRDAGGDVATLAAGRRREARGARSSRLAVEPLEGDPTTRVRAARVGAARRSSC